MKIKQEKQMKYIKMKEKTIESSFHDVFISIACGVISALIVLISQLYIAPLNLGMEWIVGISIFGLIVVFMIMNTALNFFKIIRKLKLCFKKKYINNNT